VGAIVERLAYSLRLPALPALHSTGDRSVDVASEWKEAVERRSAVWVEENPLHSIHTWTFLIAPSSTLLLFLFRRFFGSFPNRLESVQWLCSQKSKHGCLISNGSDQLALEGPTVPYPLAHLAQLVRLQIF